MQERPMLGGNASSEVRMWVCGAHGPQTTGKPALVEELNAGKPLPQPGL